MDSRIARQPPAGSPGRRGRLGKLPRRSDGRPASPYPEPAERGEPGKTPMNLLEDPGRYHWKWIAITVGLLVLYGVERAVRTGGLF